MKVLFVGDVHVKFSNMADVDKLIDAIGNVEADIAVLAGDVLDTHERIHTQLMNKAIDLIEAMSRKMFTYVLVGNHDYIDNSQYCSTNHWMNGLKRFQSGSFAIVDTPTMVGDDIVMVPYVPPGRFVEALDQHVPQWRKSKCIFAHQEFRGCRMGAIVSEEGDEWSVDLPQVISGHVHDTQRHQTNVYYPGSSLNHSYSNDSNGVCVFTIHDDGSMDELTVPLRLEKKRIAYMSVAEMHPPFDPSVKYSLEGTIPEIAAFKKSDMYRLARSTCKVVFREKKQVVDRHRKRVVNGFRTILEGKISACEQQLQKDYLTALEMQ